MGLFFGCSGHHFEDTNKERLLKVTNRSYMKHVYPDDEKHPYHEEYIDDSERNGLEERFDPVRKYVKVYRVHFQVKKRCKHDGCSKETWKTRITSFEDEDKAMKKAWEAVK